MLLVIVPGLGVRYLDSTYWQLSEACAINNTDQSHVLVCERSKFLCARLLSCCRQRACGEYSFSQSNLRSNTYSNLEYSLTALLRNFTWLKIKSFPQSVKKDTWFNLSIAELQLSGRSIRLFFHKGCTQVTIKCSDTTTEQNVICLLDKYLSNIHESVAKPHSLVVDTKFPSVVVEDMSKFVMFEAWTI